MNDNYSIFYIDLEGRITWNDLKPRRKLTDVNNCFVKKIKTRSSPYNNNIKLTAFLHIFKKDF